MSIIVRFKEVQNKPFELTVADDEDLHLETLKHNIIELARTAHKHLELITNDYAVVPTKCTEVDEKYLSDTGLADDVDLRELFGDFPSTPMKLSVVRLLAVAHHMSDSDTDDEDDGKQEHDHDPHVEMVDISASEVNQQALSKRPSLSVLGGKHHTPRPSQSPAPITPITEEKGSLAEDGAEQESKVGLSEEKNEIVPLQIDEVLHLSEEVLACYKLWEPEKGLKLLTQLLPALMHVRGDDYPLVKKLRQVAHDFESDKRHVRFMLTAEQSVAERTRVSRAGNNSEAHISASTLLALSSGDAEIEEHLKRAHCDDESKLKSGLRQDSAELVLLKERIRRTQNSWNMTMKYGTCVVKYKDGVATDRWLSVNKSADKIMWRKPSAEEKSKGKKGGFSFARGRERNLSDVEAIYYGPQGSEGFQQFIEAKGKPWLCFSIEFGKGNMVDLVCPDEATVTTWFLGVQSLSPLSNSFLSRGLFLWQRLVMKINYYSLEEVARRQGVPLHFWRFNAELVKDEIDISAYQKTERKTK